MRTLNRPFFALKPTILFARETVPGGGGGETTAGGSGGEGGAGQLTLQQQIDAAVEAAVGGLKSKNNELLGKLKTKTTELEAYSGLDPVRAKSLIEAMDADEDTKLLAEGKKNEVIAKHTERMRRSHEGVLEEERGRTAAEKARAEAFAGAVLDNQIRSVCVGLHKGAVDDALLAARQLFSLDAKGNAVKLDSEGRPELGKDGKTPFNPVEWMEMQRELKPHWFPADTSGSGSGGASGASGAGKTKSMRRSAFDQLTVTAQGEFARSGGAIVD